MNTTSHIISWFEEFVFEIPIYLGTSLKENIYNFKIFVQNLTVRTRTKTMALRSVINGEYDDVIGGLISDFKTHLRRKLIDSLNVYKEDTEQMTSYLYEGPECQETLMINVEEIFKEQQKIEADRIIANYIRLREEKDRLKKVKKYQFF